MKLFSSSSPLVFISLLLSIFTFSSLSDTEAASNFNFNNYHQLPLPNTLSGPESLAFDCHGDGPYTGIYDGRIFRWRQTHNQWLEFAVNSPNRNRTLCDGSSDKNMEHICGRPLGLKFDTKTCNLYFVDAYFGLLMVGPNGGVAKTVAISADGVPFKYLNDMDIDDQTGIIYFSETSTVYQRRELRLILENGDKSGRLMRYNPSRKKVEVLVKGLEFANGVAVSKDGSFVLIAESIPKKIHKLWLRGSKAYTLELFAQVERLPDNINRNENGEFWVGLNSNRSISLNASASDIDAGLQKVGEGGEVPWRTEEEEEEEEEGERDPVGVKFDDKGEIMKILDGRGGKELESVSEVDEHDGRLWVGSSKKSYIVVFEICSVLSQ